MPQGPPSSGVLALVYQPHRTDGSDPDITAPMGGRSRASGQVRAKDNGWNTGSPSAIADSLRKSPHALPSAPNLWRWEVLMRRKPKPKRTHVRASKAGHDAARGALERNLSPVVWVGWQIRPGEKYFGIVQRADGTVERTRLERDDLQAAADFVTAYKSGNAASIRCRQVRRLP